MSSYVGFVIFMLWMVSSMALYAISENIFVLILVFIFSFIIVGLSLKLDTLIESRSKNNKEDKKQNGLPN